MPDASWFNRNSKLYSRNALGHMKPLLAAAILFAAIDSASGRHLLPTTPLSILLRMPGWNLRMPEFR